MNRRQGKTMASMISIKAELEQGKSVCIPGKDVDIHKMIKILDNLKIFCTAEKAIMVKNMRYIFNDRGEPIGIEPSKRMHTGYILKKI